MGMGLRLPKSESSRGPRHAHGAPGRGRREPKKGKKKSLTTGAWQEAKRLIWARRGRLGLGLTIMLVNRIAGLVLPATSQVSDRRRRSAGSAPRC